ncbi:MAG: hypothetical protein VKS61_15395, partial [Candidatus Sericytochromatia bacterium]|nr:hypothetical protein [Candidatus Sericytochromatia bacterium]
GARDEDPDAAPTPFAPGHRPVAADARQRLTGSVVFNDAPVADATLTAIDLATGQALTLRAWSDAGNGATGTQRTDAKGAFDLELPKLADDQLVKLVAVSGSQTYTALFDARGRAVGAAGAQGASYKLAQGQAVSITIRLKLTAATTAAAKAFEGALKLTFQLPREAREAERAAALAAAEAAAKEVEAALAAKPELASDLVVSVGADGEVKELDGFRSAMAKLGVFDKVFEAVQGRLVAVTAQQLTAEGTLDAITAEDFPLDRVTIREDGGFSFTGGSVASLGGSVTSNYVPTPERKRSRGEEAAPAAAPPVAPADSPVTMSIVSPMGLTVYGDLSAVDSARSYYTLAAPYASDGDLYLFDQAGDLVATADLGAQVFPTGLGALPASTTIMVSSQAAPGIRRFRRTGAGTYTEEASGSVEVAAYGGVVANGRYWAFSGTTIRSWPLSGDLSASETVQFNGRDLSIASDMSGENGYALAVQADGGSTHIYWIDPNKNLYRHDTYATGTVAERIYTFSGPGADRYGGVAAAGSTLYAAAGGSVYRITNPRAASSAIDPDPIASYTGNFPFGGAQARAGSVVFAITTGGVQRFTIPQ